MTFAPEIPTIGEWGAVHRILAPAIEREGNVDLESLIDCLLDGSKQLWIKREAGRPVAAAVTERFGDTLHCHFAGGLGAKEWAPDLYASCRSVAELVGINRLSVEARPGWERLLSREGWKRKAVIMECEVCGG